MFITYLAVEIYCWETLLALKLALLIIKNQSIVIRREANQVGRFRYDFKVIVAGRRDRREWFFTEGGRGLFLADHPVPIGRQRNQSGPWGVGGTATTLLCSEKQHPRGGFCGRSYANSFARSIDKDALDHLCLANINHPSCHWRLNFSLHVIRQKTNVFREIKLCVRILSSINTFVKFRVITW